MSEEKELAPLFSGLEKLELGKGKAVFIGQDAGITADTASEAARFLQEKGWKTLSGRWEEGSTHSAISSALSGFIAQQDRKDEPPTIISAYVYNLESGFCLAKFETKEEPLDADIFSGMHLAVQNFIKDSMGTEDKGLESAEIGGSLMLSKFTENFGIVLVVDGAETPSMRFDLSVIAQRIEAQYGDERITGNMEQVKDMPALLASAINEAKYKQEFIDQTKASRMHSWRRALSRALEGSKDAPVALILDNAHLADSTATGFIYDAVKYSGKQGLLLVAVHQAGKLEESAANPALEGTIIQLLEEGACSQIELKGGFGKALAPKLGEVSETDLRILSACAVSGPEIEPLVIVGASGALPEEVNSALSRFESAGFLRNGRMRGKKVSEEIISRTENIPEISLKAAVALEALYSAELSSHCERLARLYCSAAGTSEEAQKKAVDYSLMSASAALSATQNPLALAHYERALEFCDDKHRRMGILESTVLLERAMRLPERMKHCDQLQEIAEELGDKRRLAMAHWERAHRLILANKTAKADHEFDFALIHFASARDLEGMARAYNGMAGAYTVNGRHDLAIEYAEKAIGHALKCGSQREVAIAKTKFAHTHKQLGNFEEAREYYEGALDIFQALDSKSDIPITLVNIASTNFNIGMRAKAAGDDETMKDSLTRIIESGTKCREISKETGNINEFTMVSNTLVAAHADLGGSLSEAERFAKDALTYARIAGNIAQEAAAFTNLTDLYLRHSHEFSEKARALLPRISDSNFSRVLSNELDRLDAEMGRAPAGEFKKYYGVADKKEENKGNKKERVR